MRGISQAEAAAEQRRVGGERTERRKRRVQSGMFKVLKQFRNDRGHFSDFDRPVLTLQIQPPTFLEASIR